MVYLKKIIEENRDKLIRYKNIELVAYFSIVSPDKLNGYDFDLSPDEEYAFKGYKKENVSIEYILPIMSKPPVKGMNAISNIYKFSGLYLTAKDELSAQYKTKFIESDMKQKYFMSKIEPSFLPLLRKEVETISENSISTIIKYILNDNNTSEDKIDQALIEITKDDLDVQTQILLEDLEKSLLKVKYISLEAEDLIRCILNNFSNSIQKIKVRRKDHPPYTIEDEYDVQDILYVIIKSIFPNLRDEDAIAKVGAKSTKIDLILRDEQIMIEVKMVKMSDKNEVNFIEQLKIDIESYHQCKWLNKLFCFVYDPYRKTKDIANFHDLNGMRNKNGHEFDVEIIVVS